MFESPYPSPTRTHLFINGYHIDDAAAINYTASDPRTPIYGYNDRDYRTTAIGKSIVRGQLMIHFRYFGYLTYAIQSPENYRLIEESIEDIGVVNDYQQQLNDQLLYRDFEDSDSKATAIFDAFRTAQRNQQDRISSRPRDAFKAHLSFAQSAYWDRDRDPSNDGSNVRPSRSRTKFDIVVRYGDIQGEWDPGTTLVLEDVELEGQSTMVSAEVPNDASTIREMYPFVAKSIRPLRVVSQNEQTRR